MMEGKGLQSPQHRGACSKCACAGPEGVHEGWLLSTTRKALNHSSPEQSSGSRMPRCLLFSLGGKTKHYLTTVNFREKNLVPKQDSFS